MLTALLSSFIYIFLFFVSVADSSDISGKYDDMIDTYFFHTSGAILSLKSYFLA